MTNVPTDLLRTLIAVVDLRSFTRAAQSLGVTQPAVSAQIKRLQTLLGGELFDKSAPGVTLTAKGEMVVNYARRLLALNDQMLDVTARGSAAAQLRIGLATDYFEAPALRTIAEFQAATSALRVISLPSRRRRCCAICAAAITIWSSRLRISRSKSVPRGPGWSRPRGGACRRRPWLNARVRSRWSWSVKAACRGG